MADMLSLSHSTSTVFLQIEYANAPSGLIKFLHYLRVFADICLTSMIPRVELNRKITKFYDFNQGLNWAEISFQMKLREKRVESISTV